MLRLPNSMTRESNESIEVIRQAMSHPGQRRQFLAKRLLQPVGRDINTFLPCGGENK